MDPIYNPEGEVVAWKDNDIIHDLSGDAIAFLDDNNVVSYGGLHLGVFDKGFFRDHNGDAVAFMEGAPGGPLTPIPSVPSVPPIPSIATIPPIPPIPPIPAIPSLSWSALRWEEFISG